MSGQVASVPSYLSVHLLAPRRFCTLKHALGLCDHVAGGGGAGRCTEQAPTPQAPPSSSVTASPEAAPRAATSTCPPAATPASAAQAQLAATDAPAPAPQATATLTCRHQQP